MTTTPHGDDERAEDENERDSEAVERVEATTEEAPVLDHSIPAAEVDDRVPVVIDAGPLLAQDDADAVTHATEWADAVVSHPGEALPPVPDDAYPPGATLLDLESSGIRCQWPDDDTVPSGALPAGHWEECVMASDGAAASNAGAAARLYVCPRHLRIAHAAGWSIYGPETDQPRMEGGWHDLIDELSRGTTARDGISPAPTGDDLRFPDPPDPMPEPNEIKLGELTGELCRAVGLDPVQVQGFRLTVMGGAFPTLEVWHLPPHRDGHLLDTWVKPLGERMADTTLAILPGSGATVPPVRDPGDPAGPGWVVPDELACDAAATRILPMLADIINGAPVSADLRDELTSLAHQVSADMARRVWAGRRPAGT